MIRDEFKVKKRTVFFLAKTLDGNTTLSVGDFVRLVHAVHNFFYEKVGYTGAPRSE